MAGVDTEDKRRSAIGFLMMTVAPVPDGIVDDSDRQQAAWIYSGVSLPSSGGREGLLLGVH